MFSGFDSLGACSYANEAEFRADDGYFPDMKQAAVADLKARMQTEVAIGKRAECLLKLKLLNQKTK